MTKKSFCVYCRRKSLVKQLSISDDLACPPPTTQHLQPPLSSRPSLVRRASLTSPGISKARMMRRESIQSVELESVPGALAPQVEGRIVQLDEQVLLLNLNVALIVPRLSFSLQYGMVLGAMCPVSIPKKSAH